MANKRQTLYFFGNGKAEGNAQDARYRLAAKAPGSMK